MKKISQWESFEALEECIRRDTGPVAKALHQSVSLTQKWKEAPSKDDNQQSGARNPLDRIEILINTIKENDPDRAYAPIFWLCARFSFLPPVKMPSGIKSDDELMTALLKWIGEVGETSNEIKKAMKDGRVTLPELKEISREFREDIEAGMVLFTLLEERSRKS